MKLVMIGLIASLASWAITTEQTKEKLQEFRSNPFKFMNTIPEKNSDIESEKDVPIRAKIRLRKKFTDPKAGHNPSNLKTFLDNDNNYLDNIQKIHQLQLFQAELEVSPWSSGYWPISEGVLAARYADRNSPYGD